MTFVEPLPKKDRLAPKPQKYPVVNVDMQRFAPPNCNLRIGTSSLMGARKTMVNKNLRFF